MPKQHPTTREEHRQEKRDNYLRGNARNPYRHTPVHVDSDDDEATGETGETSTASSPNSGVCPKCSQILKPS